MKKRAFSMVGLLSVLALIMSGCGTPEQEKEPVVQEQQTEQTSVFLEKCSLTLPVCTVSLNTPDNELAIQEKYGLTLDEWNALANDSDSFLRLDIPECSDPDASVNAEATITANGVTDTVSLTGRLTEIKLDNGDQCFAGGLSGYLNGDSSRENAVTLSVNYDKTAQVCYVIAQIGDALCLDFGTPFGGQSKIYQKLKDAQT